MAPRVILSDDQDGNLYLFAAAGSAIRTLASGAVEQRLRAYFLYAASRAEADHLAMECIARDAPAKEGWRDLDATARLIPEDLSHELSRYPPECCLRPGGCCTPGTCAKLGCRHAALRGLVE